MYRIAIVSIALGALLVAGCANSREAGVEIAVSGPFSGWFASLDRVVRPFDVFDTSGEPQPYPFLGGLNVPRPQLIDIDGDGDDDLFLQERTGELIYFEHVGGTFPPFEWRTDSYQELDVGEWFRFADLDGDGDYDLLGEQPFSYIRYFQNVGSPTRPVFEGAADSLRDTNGTPVFSDRQNIPNVNDIDNDGLPDLFIGRLDGTVTRYEARSVEPSRVPRFELIAARFEGIEIVSQFGQPGQDPAGTVPLPNVPGGDGSDEQPPRRGSLDLGGEVLRGGSVGPELHGANTMTFVDIDADGDDDLFWGDYFEPGLLLLENTGSPRSPSLGGEPRPFPQEDPIGTSGYNAPAFGDVDGDGDLDLLIGVLGGAFNPNRTAHANFYFLEQTAGDRFQLRTRRLLHGIDVGNDSYPELADIDGDGDLDLFVANRISAHDPRTAILVQYENTGTPADPAMTLRDTLQLVPSYHYAPAFADIDADGDLDMLLGTWNRGIALYRNEGTASEAEFVLESESFLTLTRGSHATPVLADIDDDGDLDLFVGETSGTINFYRNNGTSQDPAFELISDEFAGIDVGRRSAPEFIDIDGDGDLDLVIGTESDGLALFANTGTIDLPDFSSAGSFAEDIPELATPAFGDLDGDGDVDLIVGGLRGGLIFLEQRGP